MRCLQDTARVVLALWLALAPVKAWAGSLALLGAGGASVAGVLPTPTYTSIAQSSGTNVTQTWSVSLPAGAQKFVVMGLGGFTNKSQVTGLAVAPNVGTTINLAQVIRSASNQLALWSGVLLSDADSATTATITITYSANPVSTTMGMLWTVPSANLSSQTPTGSNSNSSAATTTSSTTVATTSGGMVLAFGQASTGSNTPASFTGTETYTNQTTLNAVGLYTVQPANAQGVATNASSTLTTTFTNSTTIQIIGASWR